MLRTCRLLVAVVLCGTVCARSAAVADPAETEHDAKATEHYTEGTRLAERGDHAGAIKEFREATRIEPRWVEVRNDLGVELYLTGDAPGALEQLRTAADMGPERGAVQVNLAFALYDVGQIDEAVSAWREALKRGARVADAYAGLALGLFKQGHVDEALRNYQIAIDRDKSYAEVEHLGAGGAGWSPHAVADAAVLLQTLQSRGTASTTPATQ